MDEDIAHVALVRRLGKAPVFLHFIGKRFQRAQFIPALAAVLAAEKPYRLDAGIDDIVARRIDGDGSNVAFEDPIPRFSRVGRAIETVVRHADVDALGTIAAAVDRIDNAVAERMARLLPAAVARAPHDEPVLRPGVQSHSVGHDRSYGNSSTLPVPGCLSQRASTEEK